MAKKIILSCIISIAFSTISAFADPLVFVSKPTQVSVIELYTSEGCSSCPVAEKWLSKLKNDKQLWTDVIPLAFHVDYWNYLGWRDEFSSKAFSQRQRLHQTQEHVDSVYTPGFVINGKEWRGFFNPIIRSNYSPNKGSSNMQEVGILVLTKEDYKLKLELRTKEALSKNLVANIAYLATDVSIKIKAGENKGKTLKHDFIVLKHLISDKSKTRPSQQTSDNSQNNIIQWTLRKKPPENATAIAAWISRKEDLSPIQAVGGWL